MPIKKIINNFHQLGAIEGGWYCLAVFLRKTSRDHIKLFRYIFVAQPIPNSPSTFLRPTSKIDVGFVTLNDPLVGAFPPPYKVIKKRFDDGNICIAAKNEGRFAGYIWIANDRYDEDEVRCRYQLGVQNNSVWDFDVYVHPEYRLGRCLARLWDFTSAYLTHTGKKWSFSRIAASNLGSMRSHRRLGIRTLFTASFFCIGDFQLMLSLHKPFIHISFSSSQIPTLYFDIRSSNVDTE